MPEIQLLQRAGIINGRLRAEPAVQGFGPPGRDLPSPAGSLVHLFQSEVKQMGPHLRSDFLVRVSA